MNLLFAGEAVDRLGPLLLAAGDVLAQVLDLEHGRAHIVLDDGLEETLVWLGRARVVGLRLARPPPLLGFRGTGGRNSDRHRVLGLNSTGASSCCAAAAATTTTVFLDIGQFDRCLLLLGFHIDRLLGGLGGARLARTKRSLGAVAALLLFLYRRRLVGFVGAQSFERVQQGLVDEAVVVQPLLALLVCAADQPLVRVLGAVALAARLGGLRDTLAAAKRGRWS